MSQSRKHSTAFVQIGITRLPGGFSINVKQFNTKKNEWITRKKDYQDNQRQTALCSIQVYIVYISAGHSPPRLIENKSNDNQPKRFAYPHNNTSTNKRKTNTTIRLLFCMQFWFFFLVLLFSCLFLICVAFLFFTINLPRLFVCLKKRIQIFFPYFLFIFFFFAFFVFSIFILAVDVDVWKNNKFPWLCKVLQLLNIH